MAAGGLDRRCRHHQHGHSRLECGAPDAQFPGAARAETRGADQAATPRRVEGQEEVTIPVVEEDLTVGTREVERGHVRIYSRGTEQPVEEAVRLREERVTVERRPVDRPAGRPTSPPRSRRALS